MRPAPAAFGPLAPGTRVEIYNSFALGWSHGFEVIGTQPGGYLVRRLSDGAVLPVPFAPDTLRPA